MNRVDGMEALDAVENGMIKLGQSRDIWQNDVVYAALAGVRLLLLDSLGKLSRTNKKCYAPVVPCGECVHRPCYKIDNNGEQLCPVSGMKITKWDYCSYGEKER